MILIIDNYDSFTYNLVQLFESRGIEVKVALNDQITINDIKRMKPKGIILSPGPCTPKDAGICIEVVKTLYKEYPLLGVCLGHQVIGEAFGSKIVNASHIVHGKTETIRHNSKGLFRHLQAEFQATRYHSLIIDKKSLSSELVADAYASSDGNIMAIRHKQYPIFGVQFHPESYATQNGYQIADNFIKVIHQYEEEILCH